MENNIFFKEERSQVLQSEVLQVAICFCECRNKILFLQRSNYGKEPGTWTAPGGKINKGETPVDAGIREFSEETGISLSKDSIKSKGSFIASTSEKPIMIHLFQIQIDEQPIVTLSMEHQTYRWCSLEEIWGLPLISGAHRCLEIVYSQ